MKTFYNGTICYKKLKLTPIIVSTLGDSGKNLEDFDHGGEKAAYCGYQLGLYSKTPAKSSIFHFFLAHFMKNWMSRLNY